MKNRIQAKIKNRKKVAEGTYKVDFSVAEKVDFIAGQHTGVWLPKFIHEDSRGNFRLFSICSSPNNKKEISITFRDRGSGFKRTLLELPIGTEVNLMKPAGFFVLPADGKQKVGFIAGGIGITPFMSMINFATEEKTTNKIVLYYVNSSAETAAFLPELKELEKKNKNFSLNNFIGREKFTEAMKKMKNQEEFLWYIAGPPGMVAEMRNILFLNKVNPAKILTEEFEGY
jgi:ferredoxin-NADP reductase